MDSSVPGRRPSALGWLSRYAPGPMRRKVDRFESAVVVLAVLTMILAIPFAVWTGSATREAAAHRAATSHRTDAILLEDAPRRMTAETGELAAMDVRVRARWHTADGTPREGNISAPPGARAHSTAPVWLDENGRVTQQPPGPGGVQATAALTGFAAYVAVGMVVFGMVALLRWQLDRIRAAQWAHEWELVAPIWTRQY